MPKRDWRHYPHIGVALFALIALGTTALGQKYQVISKAEYHATQSNLTDSNSSVVGTQPPERNPKPDREEWRQEQDLAAQRQMALWAALMFFVTSAGVWYVAQTLDATKVATKAAIDAVKVTDDAAKRQLRAYLGVTDASIRFPRGGRKTPAKLTIKNCGQTPAFKVRSIGTFAYINKTPLESDFEEVVFPPDTSSSIVLPGEPMTVIINSELVTDEEARGYTARPPRFYVWGRIVYEDIYGREWNTRFRFDYCGVAFNGEQKMAFSPSGNEAT